LIRGEETLNLRCCKESHVQHKESHVQHKESHAQQKESHAQRGYKRLAYIAWENCVSVVASSDALVPHNLHRGTA